MKIRAMCALFLIVLCDALSSTAQEIRPLPKRIVDSVEKHEKWESKVNDRVASTELDVLYLEWRTDKSWLDTLIMIHPTADGAKRMFSKKGPEQGEGMRVLKTRVSNLGDENLMWEDIYRKGRQGIVFRKANVLVKVDADSMENAKKLAFHIAKEIP